MDKKLIRTVIALVLSMGLLLCSCSPTLAGPETESDASSDSRETVQEITDYRKYSGLLYYFQGYLYFFSDGVLKKCNVLTDEVSCACMDPLCKHNSPDCPAFSTVNPDKNAVSLQGARLYYTRRLGNGRWEYGYMDLVSGSFSVLDKGVANGWTQFGVDVYTDNYRYWHEQIQENGELFYLVNRMNLQNGTVETVKKTASTDIYGFYNTERCVVAVGDRIITADAHHLYSCDENLENRKLLLDIETENLIIHEGEDCVYYWSMDPGAEKTITKLPLDGSSPEVIVRTAVVWTITSKYVYYLKNESKDSEFSYYQKNGKTGTEPLRYTQMRRCCLDGSEDEFLMNLVTDTKIIRLTDLFPVGDYVYALARIFVTPDENGIYTLYSTGKEISTGRGNISTLVKIDVKTGEFVFVG